MDFLDKGYLVGGLLLVGYLLFLWIGTKLVDKLPPKPKKD